MLFDGPVANKAETGTSYVEDFFILFHYCCTFTNQKMANKI